MATSLHKNISSIIFYHSVDPMVNPHIYNQMWKMCQNKNIEFRNKQIFAAALTIVLVEWFRVHPWVHLVSGRNRLKAHQTKNFLLFLPYFIIFQKKWYK